MLIRPLATAMLLGVFVVGTVQAEVERFELKSREPFAGGKSFGQVGVYQRIQGTVHFTLNPQAPQNQNVVDLQFAPREADGLVRYSADVCLLAPQDLSKARGALLYDVNNRGNKLALNFFNFGSPDNRNDPRTEAQAGDGFLMKQGIVVLWSGWIGELLPGNERLRLHPPTTVGSDKPLTGPVRYELFTAGPATALAVNGGGHGAYDAVDPQLKKATLTRRQRPEDPRVPVAREKWTGAWEKKSDESSLSKLTVRMEPGFAPGFLYELIYQAKNPLVMGTGLTSVRDLVSALRYGDGKDNPLLLNGKPVIRRTHGFGVSQSGRFLRELVYWGLNEDERGRRSFDAVIPHVSGGGLGSFNYRFCQPTAYNTQFRQHEYPSDRFPFAYEIQEDSVSKQRDGILQRCRESTAPYIFHTQSSSEYWHRSGSLAHTDTLGKKDSQVPDTVRIYIFGGTQHGPASFPPGKSGTSNAQNPGEYQFFLKALLLRLDQWVADGTKPPASVYPTITSGNLISPVAAATGFPRIPQVAFPAVWQQPSLWKLGPRWEKQRLVDQEPPGRLADYVVLVPRFNADGNEMGCLNPVEVAVPVASYTGWNLIRDGTGADGNLASLCGSYIPFPRTRAERLATKDPRRSVQERYESVDVYIAQMKTYCDGLLKGGYLRAADVPRILETHRKRVEPLFNNVPLQP
ncbi:MAG: alpha/beta hydrolase domain-containing protein [Pirellulaceae bacterium]|nr:alpha/beta hydrolase domain-containing protein [Pirellulaceae bacterium]